MRFLLYPLSFIFLDALIPVGCRSERPRHRETICHIDSSVKEMGLTYGPVDSLLHKWSIEIDSTTATLSFTTFNDSVLEQTTRELDEQTREALVNGINECHLRFRNNYDVYCKSTDQVTTEFWISGDGWYESGIESIAGKDTTYQTLLGNVDSLRVVMRGVFPDIY